MSVYSEIRQKPVTLGVIFLAALLLFATHLLDSTAGEPFLYRDSQGETSAFRMLAPIFLHGGLLHIAMNSAILYRVGGDIEAQQGSLITLLLVVMTGLAGNIAQAMAFDGNFGGLSGVVFGLFGYAMVFNRLAPHRALPIPPGIFYACVILLLGGYAFNFVIDHMDSFNIYLGNEAHLGGFMAGITLGLVMGLIFRRRKTMPHLHVK